MSEVTKFIPMEETSESVGGNIPTEIENSSIVGTEIPGTPAIENAGTTGSENASTTGMESAGTTWNEGVENGSSTFKVCGSSTNLPAKPSLWTRIKNILFYEIKVELTPHQQKVEKEINDFLHKEITWKSVKDFLFQEIKLW